jgi:hypothetical protein
MDANEFLARLDKANNEDEVRQRFAGGQYSGKHQALAKEWLRRREEARAVAAAERAEAREDESLSISRKALKISERSHRLSVIAIVVSTISAIIAAIITAYVQYISTAP